ncbi:CRISPR-associated helicase/endonuclease Cas3 [Caenispirillum bisanense]|uniref:CRISPR-associated helicase, Cas3 family n=1 Tax=Caenispirillum bisanense TaxID=414052 RepID=A0A286GVA5_9PROT|nr:CRISPR-associated helicase/endonuclease Cas3 [Caenispirillum bisanense]SOD99420.1 CRISPR-associated helicase, Cas3 family [Caenispirillum bisanense]
MHHPPPYVTSYWGKARLPDDLAVPGEPDWHPAAYHMLDVAAVAGRLMERRPDLAARAERVMPGLAGLLPMVAGLHDLGKLSTWFQDMRPDLVERLTGAAPVPSPFKGFRHGEAGLLFWNELRSLRETVAEASRCPQPLLDLFLPASFGHHGQPPAILDNVTPPARSGGADVIALAAELASLLAPPQPVVVPSGKVRPAAWLTAGLCILADWIGSNRRWFPYRAPDLSLADYWHTVARPAAERAVAEAGLEAPAPAGYRGFTTLFPTLPRDAAPSPLQRLCETLPVAEGPQIVVVEDVTGSGKTEAALVLAARMMAAGQGSRVFVGLPTQATADAMFKRLGDSYRRLFADGARPTLALAHGRAGLHAGFREAVLAGRQQEAERQGGEERDTASVVANAWLADNRKKALLADVGVGTLDQALLGALPVRHQALRLLGSTGGILVVDEVHAYDAYTGGLLAGLLTFHAALGGSAVVMSATLAGHQRRALIEAFAAGLGQTLEAAAEDPAAAPYPLVTRWSEADAAPVAEPPPPPAAPPRRPPPRLRCTRLRDEAAAVAVLVETARGGGCGCWVRNTIKDARTAFAVLSDHLPPDDLLLFHAAFIPADRSQVEQRVLHHFGKTSRDAERRGRILVATQVVEQSLDLDFDTLVTDLAPVDLIVQRAGRQHRHPDLRPPRPEPVLHVLGPEAVADPAADWYEAMFPAAAHVYKDAGRLWLTQHLLTGAGAPAAGWDLVAEARRLIETVYGPDSLDAVPPGLQESSCGEEGTRDAHRWLARKTMLRPDKPFALRDTAWEDDIRARTRLGDERVPLVLAVEGPGGTLLPLSRADRTSEGAPPDPFERRRAWAESEISVAARGVATAAPPPPRFAEAAAALRRDLGWQDDGPLLVVLTLDPDAPPGTGWVGTLLREDRPATLRYRRETGLALA